MERRKSLMIAAVLFVLCTAVFSMNEVQAAETLKDHKTLTEYQKALDSYNEIIGYRAYKEQFDETKRPDKSYTINAADYVRTEGMNTEAFEDYEGMEGISILTGESGFIEYQVDIEEEGFYNLSLIYYPVAGKSASIQRGIFIDGSLPYKELSLVEFTRIWVNSTDVWEKDNQGNDLKPTQVEAPEWITSYVHDSNGYITENLSVYMTKGTHRITLVSSREPVLLRRLILDNREEVKEYEDVIEEERTKGYADSSGHMIEIQAENAARKSSQMLYPVQDKGSPAITPYSPKLLKNNSIGGYSWRLSGQWIEWDFEAPEDGYYYITLHAKQNFVKGIYTSRKITIDGAVPFAELEDYGFTYKRDWTMETLSNKEGNAYRFYLTKGKHSIRMENVLGKFSGVVNNVENIMARLNTIYRNVVRIVGVSPDQYRDYQIEKSLPGLKEELITARDGLDEVILDLRAAAGRGSDKETVLITMRDQLNMLIKNGENFSKVMNTFKVNVSALGTWITQVIEQPLQLDAIYVYSPGEKLPKVKNSFWDKAVHEIKTLYYSFVIDYNRIGNVNDKERVKTITIWVGTGRDQANVVKSLIDESFTKNTGIGVNVMLVDMNTLLQATLAGQGPDVALQVAGDLPMNYGLRNAVADLSQFKDLDEIKEYFYPSAMVPYELDGRTFGLPETQTFPVMFYRKDVLKELGLSVPKTWKELKVALSVLSKNQMDVGMLPTEQNYAMLLYQNGGSYYTEDKKASALDEKEAVNTFKEFTEYYSKYKLDRETSVEQRFRTGVAPIIIADYTVYNILQVSAPDIKGLWGFTGVPGTLREDGTINNSVASAGTASVMMEACKDKASAWEFMKWWCSADTQADYGREMESLMGASARYPTANKEAFANLPWPAEDYKALKEQFESAEGIPQVPGGYYSWRNVSNAFYRVIVAKNMQPREALTEYVKYIDGEITHKRKEFGMSYLDN